jgi:site-specific DNA recombinase
MRVIGYTRVSTDEQSKDGISLGMQARKITSYSDVKDWTVGELIQDEGQSAKSLNRPGMQRLLALVETGDIGAVVVYKLDRLTRSVADLDRLVKLFERKGTALVSLQESLDATTATGRLMMNLLASVSQWEREVIGERTRDAMQHLKAEGKPYSRPTFADRDTIAWLRAERASGRSYAELAGELSHRGVKTARGGSWHASTVLSVLRNSP